MTSRERLLRAMRHEPVDRVPVSTYELVGWDPDSWENQLPAYRRLMDVIRRETDCVYMCEPTYVKKSNDAVETRRWQEYGQNFTTVVYHSPSGDLTARYRSDQGVNTVWTLEHPLKEIGDIDRYLSLPYEVPQVEMTDFYRRQAELGDRGVMMISPADPLCLAAELFEMGTFLVYALTETERILYLMDAIHERQMALLGRILRNDVKDVVFRICGPEYATAPYLPARYFHRFVTRYLIPMCRDIRLAGGIPRIHCHGRIAGVIDEFAQTDAMALDPLEPPPDGDMPLAELKKRYGDKFCLFGNIELRELEFASRERIDALVRAAIDDAAQGSGFVLMPTASPINEELSPVTEANYMQMIESALRYGRQ
ncbi:MAG: hypothetical protein GX549_06170 [Clostridiales bacterium]|nr:hypothetical protein [Clostridiales bacterium]